MQRTIVERIDPVAQDVVSLLLRGAAGPLEPWEPGAHVDLVLPDWLTRQYSLCGDPRDRTGYRVAVRHDPLSRGIPVGSGCREGVCGSCEVRVLDGEPEHRDELGAPPGCMYPCVSRARSPRLVLDL